MRGRLLTQSEMCPVFVVIAQVFIHEPFQMPLVEHDDMVEQVPPTTLDESLCDSVLPGASNRNSD